MICVAVFENNQDICKQLKEIITRYTIYKNIELDVLWIDGEFSEKIIEKYASRIQIALISLNSDLGQTTAKVLYSYNKDSLIMLYSAMPQRLEFMLESRPKAFHLWKNGGQQLYEKFDSIMEEILQEDGLFCYQTKRTIYLFHTKHIKYLQSDLKYVEIYLTGETERERIYAKLSDIEKPLGKGFLRIHKSYIVNLQYIEKIDKKEHLVCLSTGELLPISDAQYKKVIENIEKGRAKNV